MNHHSIAGIPLSIMLFVLVQPLWALVNPQFTPVNMVTDSKVILSVEIGPLIENKSMSATIRQALLGEAPAKLSLSVKPDDKEILAELRDALNSSGTTRGLVFMGDFAKAKLNDDPVDANSSSAFLCVGLHWFLLMGTNNNYTIGKDPLDLKAVWAGGANTLEEAVKYIIGDSNKAHIASVCECAWRGSSKIGVLPGKTNGSLAFRLDARSRPGVLILNDTGDKYFSYNNAAGHFDDNTAALKLDTRSLFAAASDCNGDGRIDLFSATSTEVQLLIQATDRSFASTAKITIPDGIRSLSACATGVIVGTDAVPVLARLGKDGKLLLQPIAAAPFAKDRWGDPAKCLVADFDGDGIDDVLQFCTNGVLFYRGIDANTWAAPEVAIDGALLEGRLLSASCGDFNNDGLFDVVIVGENGWYILSNIGAGKFRDISAECGEPKYKVTTKMTGAVVCDFNNDGREDLVFISASSVLQPYFNRGFTCFAFDEDFDLREKDKEQLGDAIDALGAGSVAGLAADLRGDGVQDLVFISNKGEVWSLKSKAVGDSWRTGLSVATTNAGPWRVLAMDGKRNLGARQATPALPAFFGKVSKGPLQLSWRLPTGEPGSKSVVIFQATELALPTP